jgi:hypothetical protein
VLAPMFGPSFAGALNVNVAGQSTLDSYPYEYHTVTSHTVVSVVPLSGPVAGGTAITILGSKLTTNATVIFVEQDFSGSATGMKAECTWRLLVDMGSSDVMIRQVQVGELEGWGLLHLACLPVLPTTCHGVTSISML